MISDVPNQPKNPVRGFRIPDDVWRDLQRIAAKQGSTPSDVVRDLIQSYVDDNVWSEGDPPEQP
jgi:metal-responsive CopG/Arc/MetJ family transcriptional regulator